MAISPSGRIRINVTGARGALGIDLQGSPTPGQFLVSAPGGGRKFQTASGTGSDAGLRGDLASSNGGQYIGIGGGRTLQQFVVENSSNVSLKRTNAPNASLNPTLGGSGVLSGQYAWRVTFVSEMGETEGSARSEYLTLNNQSASLTNIPIGPSGVVARKIYRTKAGESNTEIAYLVETINNNTATTFSDNVPDGALGAQLPWVNATGGMVTLNGTSYIAGGFSIRFGENSMPIGTNYSAIAIGQNSLSQARRVLRSECIGIDAAQNLVEGQGVTAIGTHAGGALVSANDVITLGYGSLEHASKATAVISIGRSALQEITGEVSSVVAVGTYAAQLVTGGGAAVYIGTRAGYGATSGVGSTIIGHEAGTNIAASFFCTYIGLQAGRGSGNGNTGVGSGALGGQVDASNNTAIGASAGSSVTTGSNNTFVGSNAGSGSGQKADASTSTAIGFGAVNDKDQQVVIGTSDTQFIKIAGIEFTKAQFANLLTLASS